MAETSKTVPLQAEKIERINDVIFCPEDGKKLITHLAVYKGNVAEVPICPMCHTVYLPTDIVSPFYKGDTKLDDLVAQEETLVLPDKIAALPKEPPLNTESPGTVMTAAVHAPDCSELYFITITEDSQFQDSKKGKYWIRREIALVVCAAVFKRRKNFQYEGVKLVVKGFYRGPQFEKAEKHFNALSGSENAVPIYVWDSIPQKKIAQSEEVTAIVYISEKQFFAPLSVIYIQTENEYCVSLSDYKKFLKVYGVPINKSYLCTESPILGTLNPESKLKMLGYSVGAADALSSKERRDMLRKIIEAKLLTKKEIMKHLQFLIDLNEGKNSFMDSVAKWKEDLLFVSNYIPQYNEVVFGEIIKGYSG